jgi:CheY-like chemotaxis protein
VGTQRAVASDMPSGPALVLVAEDDDNMRYLLARALRRDGHDVLATSDGSSAREVLVAAHDGARRPDLLVCDVRMPRLSGLELTAWLRSRDSGLPVVLLSAFADEQTHRAASQLGVACVLSKPFELDELRTIVRQLLVDAAE